MTCPQQFTVILHDVQEDYNATMQMCASSPERLISLLKLELEFEMRTVCSYYWLAADRLAAFITTTNPRG